MKKNPVFWLMWLLPGAAVAASFATLAIALDGADVRLPSSYHWEGAALDEDFARARRAVELGIEATLVVERTTGECVLNVSGQASDALRLLFTHSHDADQDRLLLLKRTSGGEYRAACAVFVPGKWRIALDDEVTGWSLRTRIDGALSRIELRPRRPEGKA